MRHSIVRVLQLEDRIDEITRKCDEVTDKVRSLSAKLRRERRETEAQLVSDNDEGKLGEEPSLVISRGRRTDTT